MRVLEFRFTEYQQERSRDSNGQLEHVEFKDGVLSYVSEWQGYHPAGGGGRMPASDYTLDEALHAELVDYLEQNGLTTPQSEAPAADDPTLRHESRSYGQTFELTTDAGSCRIHFGYQTSGPRINAHDQHPLNLKLTALHAFLTPD